MLVKMSIKIKYYYFQNMQAIHLTVNSAKTAYQLLKSGNSNVWGIYAYVSKVETGPIKGFKSWIMLITQGVTFQLNYINCQHENVYIRQSRWGWVSQNLRCGGIHSWFITYKYCMYIQSNIVMKIIVWDYKIPTVYKHIWKLQLWMLVEKILLI